MIQSNMAPQGMAVTPHHLASESALAVLREGGNAIEAMVAAAATIAVVYPHMNGLGGDGFWLIMPPQGEPVAIDASGAAGSLAHPSFYQGMAQIPHRGPKAALTVAGTVSGWSEALAISREFGGAALPLPRLLRDAIRYAADGIPVTASQAAATEAKRHELAEQPASPRPLCLTAHRRAPAVVLPSRRWPEPCRNSANMGWRASIAAAGCASGARHGTAGNADYAGGFAASSCQTAQAAASGASAWRDL